MLPCPLFSLLVYACLALSWLVLPCLLFSCLVQPYLMLFALSSLVVSCLCLSCLVPPPSPNPTLTLTNPITLGRKPWEVLHLVIKTKIICFDFTYFYVLPGTFFCPQDQHFFSQDIYLRLVGKIIYSVPVLGLWVLVSFFVELVSLFVVPCDCDKTNMFLSCDHFFFCLCGRAFGLLFCGFDFKLIISPHTIISVGVSSEQIFGHLTILEVSFCDLDTWKSSLATILYASKTKKILVLGQNNFCLKGILAYHRT